MALENFVLAGAGLLGMIATVRWMINAHRADERRIQQRYQEWIDGGSVPERSRTFTRAQATQGRSIADNGGGLPCSSGDFGCSDGAWER
jgi:hypothetical protein